MKDWSRLVQILKSYSNLLYVVNQLKYLDNQCIGTLPVLSSKLNLYSMYFSNHSGNFGSSSVGAFDFVVSFINSRLNVSHILS